MKDILDIHTHTLASGHAYNTIMEMARAAADNGLEMLGITDHAPTMKGTATSFYFLNLHVVPREMFGIRLLLGCELNILDFDGRIDLPEEILKKMDICIASIHPPCFGKGGTKEQNTSAVVNAMKNPYVHVIGHPDDSRFELDFETIVRAAKEYHVLLELNNSSLSPNGFRINAGENILVLLKYCKQYEVSVVMSSDAHIFSDVGNHCYVKELVTCAAFPDELIVNRSIHLLEDFLCNR